MSKLLTAGRLQPVKEGTAIAANQYTKAVNASGITWKVLPDHDWTGSAITPSPVTASKQRSGANAPHLEYNLVAGSAGSYTIRAYFFPSLNFFQNKNGLQYAVSVDDESPQLVSLNKEDKTSDKGIWNKWGSENIIIKTTTHTIAGPGKHRINIWMVTPGVVLQKLVVNLGNPEPDYLGPDETHNRVSVK